MSDGERLAVTDGTALSLIDADTGKNVYERESKLRTRWHGRMAYSRTADLLAIGHMGAVTVWKADAGELLRTLPAGGEGDKVYDVAFSSDGARLAGCVGQNQVGRVVVWDSRTGKELQKVSVEGPYAWSVAWSPDGRRLAWSQGSFGTKENQAYGSIPGQVQVWDVEEGRLIHSLKEHHYAVWTVAFSPDGKRIASGGGLYGGHRGENGVFNGAGEATVWDAATGVKAATLPLPGCVFRVAFSPDSRRLAAAGGASFGKKDQGMVKVWGQDGGKVLTLEHNGPVFGVCFSPDGRRLATASASDKQVRVWDVAEAKRPGDQKATE